jgi:hypothetical protein
LASGCDWQGAAPSTFHHESAWGGLWQACGVSGSTRKEEKIAFPCCTSRGRRKGNSVVQNDTVLQFFFLHETAPFYEKRAVSFKDGASIFFQFSP